MTCDDRGPFPRHRPIYRTAGHPHRPCPAFLAGLVRETGIKVVLTGEGADEVFAGYDIFREAEVRRFCARAPGSRIRPHLFRRLYPYLPGLKQQSAEYLRPFSTSPAPIRPIAFLAPTADEKRPAGTLKSYLPQTCAKTQHYDAAEELSTRLPRHFRRWHPLHQAQYLETRLLLPGYILHQGQPDGMTHGRRPFPLPQSPAGGVCHKTES